MIKYKYIQDYDNPRRVVTVAYQVEGMSVEYGLSVCAPNDQHEKSVGRGIAVRRMEVNRGLYSGEFDLVEDVSVIRQIALDVLVQIGELKEDILRLGGEELPEAPTSLEKTLEDFVQFGAPLILEEQMAPPVSEESIYDDFANVGAEAFKHPIKMAIRVDNEA